jgi:hypothetical protein
MDPDELDDDVFEQLDELDTLDSGGPVDRELPDSEDDEEWDGLGDESDTDGELRDDEVGDLRAGRLVDSEDAGDGELDAQDVGVDGAGASAEEAAVHVTEPDA